MVPPSGQNPLENLDGFIMTAIGLNNVCIQQTISRKSYTREAVSLMAESKVRKHKI